MAGGYALNLNGSTKIIVEPLIVC